ncbi:MAG TPA: twin-arginine translocation signal domain-containing protein [Candidatus Sulfotelmatobacter sp.]|nr:twin-arginine translocation signal domain-containing protein [Candidatus Sulfotelmatobacter sp.]
MNLNSNRRKFLKKSAAATLALPLVKSLEEYALAAQESTTPAAPAVSPAKATIPTGSIGKVKISRLICGGNLISGFAHSRDLIYVSPLLKHYFTDEKILQTWALCEQHGVNTMILNPSDAQALALYKKYRARGGQIQYLAQLGPAKDDLKGPVLQAKEAGAVGAFLLGNFGDAWTREGDVKLVGELLRIIRDNGMIAGVAGHELRTVKTVEQAGFAPDFYMKTLHDINYWSKRRPDQMKEVIDNYGVDNYWCMDPKETIAYMSELKRPWIAYKVLAAGAINPRVGFKHAFDNGADFITVGMFDFQIAEDAVVANDVCKAAQNRDREWCA